MIMKTIDFFLMKFVKNKNVSKKTVLIVEFNPCHGETLPGFIKYFEDLDYNIDLLINSDLYKDKVISSFNFKNINCVFYYDMQTILNEALLLKIKKYDVVFYNSYVLYTGKGIYSIFTKNPKIINNMKRYICIEHNSLSNYERNNDKNRVATLLPNKFYSKYINPHYFFKKNHKNKNSITKFSIFARESNSQKNIDLIINSVKNIIQSGVSNFKLTLVGRISQLNIDISGYENNIEFTGYLDYETLYKKVEDCDFILPMLDPDIEAHKRFLIDSSGTFQLIYGFLKIPIIHDFFAERYGFNNKNSLIYMNCDELVEQIKYAINMTNEEYLEKTKLISIYSDILYTESLNNLKLMLTD